MSRCFLIHSSHLHAGFTEPPLVLATMEWTHVLAASNNSAAGLHAVEAARTLASAHGAEVSVLTVSGAEDPDLPPPLAGLRPMVATGVPGIEIVRTADRLGADLIVLGRQVYHREGEASLGATADMVVRRSQVPCLFIPAGQERFERGLVALDGTDRGFGVVEAALAFAGLTDAELDAVLVEPEEGTAHGTSNGRSLKAAARLTRLVTERGWPRIPLRLLRGDPVDTLLGALGDPRGDVLIIGARRGGPGGMPAGTGIGRRLLFSARCAVVTVPL